MTSIERLQISGIRSFEPSLSSRQTIYFQKPLTVILGKNGAGKTTIIEALLNACSGIMPPGSGQEKVSFIYDPQIIGESEVKAQIRLVFSARDGKMVQVIRSFKVTRMRNKTSFSTLDNTVAYEDPGTKKVISNTYKASQVDRVVPEMLGVSSAVLEHVIFCHQEASNWPLSSPLEVKKIFDEIFSATRYVLALERFRENGKEYRQELKEQEGNLRELREHREQAQSLRTLVAKKMKYIQEIHERLTETRPRLRKLQLVLTALNNVDQKVEELMREAAVLEGRVQERHETLQRTSKEVERGHNTENRFLASIERNSLDILQQLCQEYQERIADLDGSLNDSQSQLKILEQQLEAATSEFQYHSNAVHELEKEEYQHQQYCTDLRKLVNSSCDEVAEDLFVEEYKVNELTGQSILQAAMMRAKKIEQETQDEIQKLEDRIEAEEAKRQTVLRRVDVNAKEREMKKEVMEQLERRIEAAQSELCRILEAGEDCSSFFESKVCILQAEIEKQEKHISTLKEAKKHGSHFVSVQRLQNELELQSAKVSSLRDALSNLRALARKEGDAKGLHRRLMERKQDFHLQLAHLPSSFSFDALLSRAKHGDESDEVDGEKVWEQYHAAVHKVDCAVREASDKYSSSSHELARVQQLLFLTTDRQSKCIMEITHYEAELAAIHEKLVFKSPGCVVSGKDFISKYEVCLQEALAKKERTEHELNTMKAKLTCFSELWDRASTHKTCPLCQRPFDSNANGELEVFFSHNSCSSDELVKAEHAFSKATEAWLSLQVARSEVDKARIIMFQIEKLREQQGGEDREREVERLKSSLCKLESETMCDKERLEEAQTARNILMSLSGTVAEMERVNTELSRTINSCNAAAEDEKVKNKDKNSKDNSNSDQSGSIEEVMDLYEAAITTQQDLHAQLSAHQSALENDSESIAELESTIQKKKDKLFQLQRDNLHREKLEETIQQLKDEVRGWNDKCEVLAHQLPFLQSSLAQSAEALKSLREERLQVEDSGRQRVLEAQHHASQLEIGLEKASRFNQSNGFQRLQEERERVAQLASNSRSARDALCLAHEQINNKKNEKKNDEERLKVLLICRDIRTQEISLLADEQRLEEINEKLVALKGSQLCGIEDILGPEAEKASLSQLRKTITEKLRQLEKTQSQQEGSMETLQKDVEQLQKELASEKYRDIEKHYRFAFVQVETTSLTIKDIDKYYFALSTAVQSYHQEKMALINRIITDLWRQTYLGSDIDAIEIRSETEKTFGSSGRRNYNYRVIMKRGSREIDMRGRCSAGQKVLASIIIRLALSEVFCYDCGILALDEPTTNLDEENSRSLAEALRVLIESRRSVRHFQLIVITHDEQFVRSLGGHAVDRFYFVLKDQEGAFSVIEERTFDQLFI